MRQAAWHASVLIAARLGASALVRLRGFEALSDDDYARITIAQGFSVHPRLDPTGSSWLPAPFWLEGTAMRLFGPTIATATAVGVVAGCASLLVLYGAARLAGVRPTAALLGSLACTLAPVAVLAGAATVPELSVAALTAAACLLLRAHDARWLLASGLLLMAASLSRYEPWPACAVAAAVALAPLLRAPRKQASWRLGAAALALAGPCLWLAWNAYAHGHALHFLARVASYRNALGVVGGISTLLSGYPRALGAEGLPCITALLAGLLLVRSRTALRAWAAPLLAAASMLLALLAADAAGGAPTHHPERALLAVWFVGWFAAADWIDRGLHTRRLAVAAALSAAVLVADAARLLSMLPGYGVQRRTDLLAGAWLQAHLAPTDRVLLEPTDYGYFAVMAAAGGPQRFVIARSIDPRSPSASSPFEQPESLRSRAQLEGTAWVMARNRPAIGQSFELQAEVGGWQIGHRAQPNVAQ